MSKGQEGSYLVKIQDGRQVWGGEEKVDLFSYLTSTTFEVHAISKFLDERWNVDSVPFNGHENFHYSPLSVPKTTLELENQKFHLSYWFPEGPFFSEGWTDITHAILQGWYFNRNHLQPPFTEFSESINLLVQRLKQEKRLVTMPYRLLGSPERIQRSTLKVTRQTEDSIFIDGIQKFPSDSLVVHELLTFASHQDQELLFTVPLNRDGVSLHVQSGDLDSGVVVHFKNVCIPWNTVLVQEKLEYMTSLFDSDHVTTYPDYQRVSSFYHQLEWLTSLAFYVVKETGESGKLHIQEVLGELLQQLDILKAYLHLSEIKAEQHSGGVVPHQQALQTAKYQGISFYKRAIEILQRVSGELYLQNYYGDETHNDSKKLYSLISDYIASPAALSRQQYQSFHAGDSEYAWANYYQAYSTDFLKNRLKDFWDFHKTEKLFSALPK